MDLMPKTLRMAVKPMLFHAWEVAASDLSDQERSEKVAAAFQSSNGNVDPAAVDLRGFALLDLAACSGNKALAEAVLATGVRSSGRLSALMWAHWCKQEDLVVLLTSRGASLSNADLEGLQHLRNARAELEKVPETSEDSECAKETDAMQLLTPDPSKIWRGGWLASMSGTSCKQRGPLFVGAADGLVKRMLWGAVKDAGAAVVANARSIHPAEAEEPRAMAKEFVSAVACTDATPESISSAKLVALRMTAEGAGLSALGIVALRLFITDPRFHEECCAAWSALFTQQPSTAAGERAVDLQGAHAQVAAAIQSLPARKLVCFRALRLQLPGGIKDALRGHRHGMDCYRPGSIVLWRHAASCTQDAALAEELALHGQPAAGCGIVFKIRRAASARPVADFAAFPEHAEVLFPPGAVFRVVGLFPCTQECLRKGSEVDGGAWAGELGSAAAIKAQRSEAFSWEEACRARSVMVLLDEEDAGAAQKTDILI